MVNFKNKCIEPSFIPDFPSNKDFSKYYQMVMEDFQIVIDYFPLLKITSLPTKRPKEIFISGDLIPKDVHDECITANDIERNSLYILGIYPNDYPDSNIYVEDFYKKIDWSKIPDEHIHRTQHPVTKRVVLCTHHPSGEVNAFKQKDKTVAVLASAWKLYKQYKEFRKTKKWILKDLSHGSDATLQLKREGKHYDK